MERFNRVALTGAGSRTLPSVAGIRRAASAGIRRVLFRLPLFLVELVFFFLFFGLYFIGRGFREDTPIPATVNAERVIEFERWLGIFWEPAWHQWAIQHDRLMSIANFTYMDLHLPLIAVCGVLFFVVDMGKYRVLRNALLLSGLVAIPIYHLFPLTPPRLLELHGIDLGFIDTAASIRSSKADELTNNYAAMPSFHFGWILLMVYGFWWCFRPWFLRLGAAAFAAWMWCSIVFTSNHYFVDMIAGAAIVTVAFVVCLRWERYLDARPNSQRGWCYSRRCWGERFRVPF